MDHFSLIPSFLLHFEHNWYMDLPIVVNHKGILILKKTQKTKNKNLE